MTDIAQDTVDTAEMLNELIEFARLAPSAQNTQPWRFRTGPGRIDVFAEPARRLAMADGDGREHLVSVGCALELLLIAAERRGLACMIDMFPRPGREDLVATVRFRRRRPEDPFRDPALFDAIDRRQTHHGVFAGGSIPAESVERLRAATIHGEIGVFLTSDEATRDKVTRLVAEATRIEHADADVRRERAGWIATGALGTPNPLRALLRRGLSRMESGDRLAEREARRMESASGVAVIVSLTDDARSRVEAGQAALRFWLLATHLGLAVQPMTAPLRVPKLRRAVGRSIGALHACPQVMFRVGYAAREARATPRLPLDSVFAA